MRIVVQALLCTMLSAGSAAAQTGGTSSIEPRAIEALEKMARHLRSMPALAVKARTLHELVLTSGEKVQLESTVTLWARRPDRLRVDVASDRRSRQFYYDGRTVSVFGPKSGYYAQVQAPPTIDEMFAALSRDFALQLPLADLFAWDTGVDVTELLTAASAIGPATIRGTPCEQYAFRQPGLDWQIWIQRGPRPVPRRLVLTTTDDDARPQHVVELDWRDVAAPPASTFAFSPPKGAHRIPIQRADGSIQTAAGPGGSR